MRDLHSSSEKFYDRLAIFYPVIDLFLKPQKKKLLSEINAMSNGKVLEIGIGTGSHLRNYSRHEIIGIDLSEKMLAKAKRLRTNNIRLIKMNAESLLFDNETFDYAVLSHVIAVVEDPEKVLREVHRVLKPGGKVFILNHVTPDNGLKRFDLALEGFMRLLHVRSVFHLSQLHALAKFKLVREHTAGAFSYFKLLIYEKSM